MDLRVIGGEQEVEQQADGVLHGDLVRSGQALVELGEDGGDGGLEAGHAHLTTQLRRVQARLPERLDHVPDVHQVNWERRRETEIT